MVASFTAEILGALLGTSRPIPARKVWLMASTKTIVALFVGAIALAAGALRADAATKVTGLTPGVIYVAPGHGEVLFQVFNPTRKAIEVHYQITNTSGAWDLTDYSETIPAGSYGGPSFYCDDASFCGGVPIISPNTVVPSIRWRPVTGGYDFIPAGGFRTMK